MPSNDANWKQGLIFLGVGLELVTFTMAGYFGGSALDDRFQTQPWLMVTGLLLGAAMGLVHLVLLARRFF